jgi:CheY-like chemotaxis protein
MGFPHKNRLSLREEKVKSRLLDVVRMNTEDRPILLIEDAEDDVFLMKTAFRKVGISNPVQVAHDGEEAMEYLSGEGTFRDRARHPLPCLVLLDLKMPRKGGFEVLAWLKRMPDLRGVVVVVLTSSENTDDVEEAYRLGANSFLVKPFAFENTLTMAELIQRCWLMHARLPRVRERPSRA